MATIDRRAIIDKLIEGKGRILYEEGDELDARVVKIVEYTNLDNQQVWGIVHETERDQDRYNEETDFVRDPKTIWEYKP